MKSSDFIGVCDISQTKNAKRFTDYYYNERAAWENIFDVFPGQNRVLARNLHSKFPALHCNEVFGNYFEK